MTKKNNKRLLFIEDLYDFYSNKYKRSTHFNAQKTGHQIFVQVPAEFKVDENSNYKDDSLLFCKVKLMHSGENRNHSSVTDEALTKAAKTLAYKPILANFVEYEDEETGEVLKDFTSHDMTLNDDGTVNYIEKQIGCFTCDEPFFEIEESTGHNFLYGYCAIPREYTDATSIIERKGGTKISVELAVNEMTYNGKERVLELTDIVIMGATLLGKDPDTLEDVGEGMLNARLDIADFSSKNNSLFEDYESKMVELQARLEKLETACFDNKNDNSKEGGNKNLNKFEELLAKYDKTDDDITFDYAEMSDDELVEAFAKAFDETDSDDTTESDNSPSSYEDTDEKEDISENPTEPSGTSKDDDESDDTTTSTDDETKKKKVNNSLIRKYEISHEDTRYALYNLLAPYEESDNDYYYISNVFDSYFVYEGWCTDKIYRQAYTKTGDNVAFEGERVELFRELLTASEKAELESMRSNYASLKEFKEICEKNELHAKKEEILLSEKYAVISVKDKDGKYINEAFAKLASEMDNYSLTDLETKIKVIHSDYIAEHSNFSAINPDEKKTVSKKQFVNTAKNSTKPSRYGNLFSQKEN